MNVLRRFWRFVKFAFSSPGVPADQIYDMGERETVLGKREMGIRVRLNMATVSEILLYRAAQIPGAEIPLYDQDGVWIAE